MLKVVSNSTPIISLLKINRLELLQKIYTKIHIPVAVYHEIEAGKTKKYYKDLSQIDWIQITEIQDKQVVKKFPDLDAGEAEAIVLAVGLNADLILLDEKAGRYHAKHANLNVTGTIGMLIKAKSTGLIPELKPLLEELTEKDVWISDRFRREILKSVDE
jgi:predicted nucleic acid-binding protein